MLDVTIYVLRSFEVLLTVGSVFVHSIFIRKLSRSSTFHPMLKRCLYIFEMSAIFFSISHSSQAIVATLLGISERMFPTLKGTRSPLEWTNGILFLLASFAAYTLWLSQTFSVLERAVSTKLLQSYDSRFRNAKSLVVFIALFLLVDILQISLNLLRGYSLIFLMIFHSVVNLSLSVSLFRVNTKKDRIESRLNVRYQVKENLRILRVFSLIGILCMAWQVIATTLLVLTLYLYQSHASDTIGHFYLICSELYALTVTSTLLSSSVMGSSLLLRCKSMRTKKVQPAMSEGEMYLNMLKNQWK